MCAANAAAVRVLVSEANHFLRFGLAPDFNLDLKTLGERYRELASRVHPDRFVGASEAEQQRALLEAAHLNEAFQCLKKPASRALYLLTLNGAELPLEATIQDGEFLIQQMQWHEQLEALEQRADSAELAAFKQRLLSAEAATGEAFAACWNDTSAAETAEKLARRLQFLSRLQAKVRRLQERFDD
ncbi:co-chaperone HscB [Ventosimonas gracilis]|uniref:Co-chaperone protein HscB homolog n=1 Tax=Ventosimonas gracilis TaxID=1680762 RepID=A0A139SMJ1_9GAMM|nr:co-chaperone HscB [Ventosimonas gracilis]